MKSILTVLFTSFALILQAQVHTHLPDRAIEFPNVPGFLTLKADLHQHTVFSDGDVWPTIRVQEALRDRLDIISITDHIEYQPHKDDIPHPDRNRAYELAAESVDKENSLMVIRGSEITRSMPPGHANAIFIKDVNKLILDDPMDAFKEARKQEAFVFWNHPNWTVQASDGIARLTEMHRELIAKGLIQGIEVVNELTYSEEALQIALENNLAIIGTSDVHGLIDWIYDVPNGGHRPVTLIFAKEKTEASVKEALFDRRTVVWFNNTLIGRENMLLPLIRATIKVVEAKYQEDTEVLNVQLRNDSDASFMLYSKSGYTFHVNDDLVILEPHSITTLEVKTKTIQTEIDLTFTVLNAVTAPDTHPDITWHVKVAE